MSIEFLLTSLIIVATPGTSVLYTLAAGLARGSRASVTAAFGCTLGIIPHLAAVLLGLAALLHASAVAFQTLKYLGVAYLLYLAWTTLRDEGALTVEATVDPKSSRQVIVAAILVKIHDRVGVQQLQRIADSSPCRGTTSCLAVKQAPQAFARRITTSWRCEVSFTSIVCICCFGPQSANVDVSGLRGASS